MATEPKKTKKTEEELSSPKRKTTSKSGSTSSKSAPKKSTTKRGTSQKSASSGAPKKGSGSASSPAKRSVTEKSSSSARKTSTTKTEEPRKRTIKKEEPRKQRRGISFGTGLLLLLLLLSVALIVWMVKKTPVFTGDDTTKAEPDQSELPKESYDKPVISLPVVRPTEPPFPKPTPTPTPVPKPTPTPTPIPNTERVALTLPSESDYQKKTVQSSYGAECTLTYYMPKLSIPYDRTLEEEFNKVIALRYDRLKDDILKSFRDSAIPTDVELNPSLYRSEHYISLYVEYEKPVDGGGNTARYAHSVNFNVDLKKEVDLNDVVLLNEAFVREVKRSLSHISVPDSDYTKKRYLSFYLDKNTLNVVYNGGTLDLNNYDLLRVTIIDTTVFDR